MDIQTIIAVIILVLASGYTIRTIQRNWKKGDNDPKCDDCDVPDMINKQKESETGSND